MYPTDPEDWKKIEEDLETDGMSHAVGALDGKHIAIKEAQEVRQ